MRAVALAALLCVGLSGVAHAEAPGASIPPPQTPAAARHEHRRNVALALSGVGVGVSYAVALSAFLFRPADGGINRPLLITGLSTSVITPSLGQFYAGQYLTIGMGIRAAAAGLALYGATRTENVRCESGPPGSMCTELSGGAIPFLGLAAIAYIGGAAYDVGDSREAVDRQDHVSVGPMVLRSGGGLAISGRF